MIGALLLALGYGGGLWTGYAVIKAQLSRPGKVISGIIKAPESKQRPKQAAPENAEP